MKSNRDIFKILNSTSIFILVYVFPLLLSFLQTGAYLIGDTYQNEVSYIEGKDQIISHIVSNTPTYLNILTNPIFWFFISAFITQKTIKWINS